MKSKPSTPVDDREATECKFNIQIQLNTNFRSVYLYCWWSFHVFNITKWEREEEKYRKEMVHFDWLLFFFFVGLLNCCNFIWIRILDVVDSDQWSVVIIIKMKIKKNCLKLKIAVTKKSVINQKSTRCDGWFFS